MAKINGTEGDDQLQGTDRNDKIKGLGGNDSINDGGGSDTISGGDGSDSIFSESRDPTVAETDVINGDAGDDFITLRREAGAASDLRAFGGTDNDSFFVDVKNESVVLLDGGKGADRFDLRANGAALDIVTGAGSDVIVLDDFRQFGQAAVVKDFVAGPGGDRIVFDGYLSNIAGFQGLNPFAEGGPATLVQAGGSVLLQVAVSGGDPATLLVLENMTIAALTADNLGYAPDGSAPTSIKIKGTAGDDHIRGGQGNDRLFGQGGADTIEDGAGDDVINGGAGDDGITAGLGLDTVNGDAGNDVIISRFDGDDTLSGGDDNDTIYIERGAGGPASSVHGFGDAGDDFMIVEVGNASAVFLDGGEGNDQFFVYAGGLTTITTGVGSDTITPLNTVEDAFVVNDFTPGAGGDVLQWSFFLFGNLESWDFTDPFASGHVRLVKSGKDTKLQVDLDGGADDFVDLVLFKKTTVAAFTADNFDGFFHTGNTPAALPSFASGDLDALLS